MERSEIRGRCLMFGAFPDCASLHPGYLLMALHDLNLILRSARLRVSKDGPRGLMVRDARLRGLLTMRVFLALRADLPPWQIKSGHLGCGKSTRRANHF